MIILPKEKPVVENLNSYYLKIDRMLEHYRGAIESGGIHFHAPSAEAVVFFDDENVLNGFYRDKTTEVAGQEAIDRIFQTVSNSNFSVSVYRIQPDRLYYWANLPNSTLLYNDLSSEFADLEGLIKKMENEKLTGYIEVRIGDDSDHGLLFFYSGQMLGGASSKSRAEVDRSPEYRDDLIRRCREQGGVFNVHKTDMAGNAPVVQPRQLPEEGQALPAAPAAAAVSTQRVVQMLNDLLVVLDTVVKSKKRHRSDFETLLNRKFIEKVDKYEFLDPFAADIRYAKGQLIHQGEVPPGDLAGGIVECARELMAELDIAASVRRSLGDWHNTYAEEIRQFRIEI